MNVVQSDGLPVGQTDPSFKELYPFDLHSQMSRALETRVDWSFSQGP